MGSSFEIDQQEKACNDLQAVRDDLEARLGIKDDVIAHVTDHLNNVMRTMSGYAGMLERHLSIQDDPVGSEYAVGVRGGLEEMQKLLHHLRPIARNREADALECQRALDRLNIALEEK